MSERKHYLEVVSKDDALARWAAAIEPRPLPAEEVAIDAALGRVLATDLEAPIDLPPFDRALVDGYALRAKDTFAAPARLRLLGRPLACGDDPAGREVEPGAAIEIATGAVIPRGADAVVMIEHTSRDAGSVTVRDALVPGQGIGKRGGDVEQGERLFEAGRRLAARDTCVLAGLGLGRVSVVRRPRVAVVSTGDELVAPGAGPLGPGKIYDANARLVADACREAGLEPVELGIVRDDLAALRATLERARACDAVVLSGGTSKGEGDLTWRLVAEGGAPGVVVHGVSIRPGKPLVLAAWGKTPVAILPGFPTSAAVTFEVFVKPTLLRLAGLPAAAASERGVARLGVPMSSAPGRHDYVLCWVASALDGPPRAFPLLKGSGATSAFARSDAWVEVPADQEHVPAGALLPISWLDPERRGSDLVLAGDVGTSTARDLAARLAPRARVRLLPASAAAAVDAARHGLVDGAIGGGQVATEARAAKLDVQRLGARPHALVARPGVLDLAGGPTAAITAALERGLSFARARTGDDARTLLDALLAGRAPAKLLDVATGRAAARAVASGQADVALAPTDEAQALGLDVAPAGDADVVLALAPGAGRLRDALA